MKTKIENLMLYNYKTCLLVVTYKTGVKRYYSIYNNPNFSDLYYTLPHTIRKFYHNSNDALFMNNKDIRIYTL